MKSRCACARSCKGPTISHPALARGGRVVSDRGDRNSFGSGGGEDLGAIEADWEEEFRRNVFTAVLLTSAMEPRLRRPGASVVNVSSIAALAGGRILFGGQGCHSRLDRRPRDSTGRRRNPRQRRRAGLHHRDRVLRRSDDGGAASAPGSAHAPRPTRAPGRRGRHRVLPRVRRCGIHTGELVQINGGALLGRR